MGRKLPVVVVKWFDATGHEGWHTPDAVSRLGSVCVTTVGIQVSRDKKQIKLVASIEWSAANVGDMTVIPMVNVVSVTRLGSVEAWEG
jgi:hypothetical protein